MSQESHAAVREAERIINNHRNPLRREGERLGRWVYSLVNNRAVLFAASLLGGGVGGFYVGSVVNLEGSNLYGLDPNELSKIASSTRESYRFLTTTAGVILGNIGYQTCTSLRFLRRS